MMPKATVSDLFVWMVVYAHLVTADGVRVAGELGALLDKKFVAQDLPKLPPNAETASESLTEAV